MNLLKQDKGRKRKSDQDKVKCWVPDRMEKALGRGETQIE